MASRNPVVIEVMRGQVVESSHQVMAAVADEHQRIVTSWGNIGFLTLPRSAIKMIQTLPLIESGAFDRFALDDRHLALASASHRGTKEQIELAKDWMQKVGIKEEMLVCGFHPPSDEAALAEFHRAQTKPSPLFNNCIGKHLALITTCLHLKEDPKGYDKYDHPAQKRLRQVLGEATKLDHQKTPHAIDGCGVLTYGLPLQNLAMAMSVFYNGKETELRKASAARVLKAVQDHAALFSGPGDFTTLVLEKTKGKAIVKNGAEGVYCGLIPDRKVSFAVKCADGSHRGARAVVALLLRKYGAFSEPDFSANLDWLVPPVKTWKGEKIGQIRVLAEG